MFNPKYHELIKELINHVMSEHDDKIAIFEDELKRFRDRLSNQGCCMATEGLAHIFAISTIFQALIKANDDLTIPPHSVN